jgi:DegV family protein with EDD domain
MKSEMSYKKIAVACRAGFEHVAAWSDLLDLINVFPVADGDTGTNLRVSLAPLRVCEADSTAVKQLMSSGHGNSGNIATTFLTLFLGGNGQDLAARAILGRDAAYGAIADPRPGTMLSVFDRLCEELAAVRQDDLNYLKIRSGLAETVLAGIAQLPELHAAGVVDSGALGMFVFFDAFFCSYTEHSSNVSSLSELFGEHLEVKAEYDQQGSSDHCVEVLLQTTAAATGLKESIANLGSSAVVVPGQDALKVHIHTAKPGELRKSLEAHGDVLDWRDEVMESMQLITREKQFSGNRIRVMSDAAGSIPLSLARDNGLLVLDSYILSENRAVPESLFPSEELYETMKQGIRVTTAQASNHERHLHYRAVCERHGQLLYICTGSAFTGNYTTAREWLHSSESNGQMQLLDSGAASGRLGVIALLSARLAATGAAPEEVLRCAAILCETAEEYVFIHEMKYLVAGGRVSWAKGFFADMLHMKPVISPHAEGVRKITVLRNRRAQLDFALEKLGAQELKSDGLLVLLQYTDNREWLETVVEPRLRSLLPKAELLLVPLSLTSGVHMGPGTWSIAFGGNGDAQC